MNSICGPLDEITFLELRGPAGFFAVGDGPEAPAMDERDPQPFGLRRMGGCVGRTGNMIFVLTGPKVGALAARGFASGPTGAAPMVFKNSAWLMRPAS